MRAARPSPNEEKEKVGQNSPCGLVAWVCHGSQWGGKWSGSLLGRRKPEGGRGASLFTCRRLDGGQWQIVPLGRDRPPRGQDQWVCGVATVPMRNAELVFAAVASDEDGHEWDLTLAGRWSVAEPLVFLRAVALEAIIPEAHLTRTTAEAWFAERIGPKVRDAVNECLADGFSMRDLRERNALPVSWWERKLNDWLSDYGLSVVLESARWSSKSAELAEAERKRREFLKRAERLRKERRCAAEREAEAAAEHRKRIEQITHDARLSKMERENQLQLAEYAMRKNLLAARIDYQKTLHQLERLDLEHQIEMARLRNQKEREEQAKAQASETDAHYKEVLDRLTQAERTLEELKTLPDNLLARLARSETSYPTLSRLLSEEYGRKPEELAALGYPAMPNALVALARRKASTDGHLLRLERKDLEAKTIRCFRPGEAGWRDIGTKKVLGIRVNTPVAFELAVGREGYLTLINVGTSGRLWLLVPNAYVVPAEAKVAAGENYHLPGQILLPPEEMRAANLQLLETGPPGWEHLVAFVSQKPLVGAELLCRARPDEPFVELNGGELEGLVETLDGLGDQHWTSASLSFLVQE